MERNVCGYCRVQDGARIVFLEQDGGSWEADCDYEVCPYRGECPIGREITQIIAQESGT